MKKIIAAGTILFTMCTSGNAYAGSVSDNVVVMIKVEHALKLESVEKHPESILPQKSSLIKDTSSDSTQNTSPAAPLCTVTE